jgi:heptosyltransferase-2
MKILVIAPAWIGDSMMAQPLYRRLHQRYPELTLDILAPAWSQPLFARMPEVHQSINNPFAHGQLRLFDRFRLGRQLAKQHYDQAIVLPNSLKSALIPFFAGIPKRTGFMGEQRYGLLNDRRKLDAIALPRMVERFALLAEDQPVIHPGTLSNPQLQINDAQCYRTLLQFRLNLTQPVIAFCPGAEYGPAKRWPAIHFAELAQSLRQQGYQIWIFGSSKDNPIAQAILAQLDNTRAIYNLCGKTQLGEAIDLMSYAHAVVSNDSGLMHIAAALGRPLVALYGSSSPEFTPPLSDLAKIVTLNLPCSPCFKRECPLIHFNCMQHLSAPLVETAIQPLLNRSKALK